MHGYVFRPLPQVATPKLEHASRVWYHSRYNLRRRRAEPFICARTCWEMTEKSKPVKEPKPERRGSVDKCPVCGTHVDAEAYHCPACHSSFCYHCRARLLPADRQMECLNQSCMYYAKLVCGTCDSRMEKSVPPAVYIEPEEGYWPGLLVLVLVLAAILWVWTSFLWALLFAVVVYTVSGYLLHARGFNIFGRERRVEHERKGHFYACLCCHEPVKLIRREHDQ